MLPRERFGPDELLRWLEDTQDSNERARRSHAKRRAALTCIPGHPSLNCRCNTSTTTTVPQFGQLLAGNRFAEGKATKLSRVWASRHEEVLKVPFLRTVVVVLGGTGLVGSTDNVAPFSAHLLRLRDEPGDVWMAGALSLISRSSRARLSSSVWYGRWAPPHNLSPVFQLRESWFSATWPSVLAKTSSPTCFSSLTS